MTPKKTLPFLYFLYIINILIFGSSWMFNKMLLNEGVGPLWAATLRQIVAAIAFILVMIIRRPKIVLSRHDILLILFYGISMLALAHVFSFMGQQYIDSGLASIIFSIFPIVALLLSAALMPKKETPTLIKLIAAILGFLGIIIIFYSKGNSHNSFAFKGISLILLAVFANTIPNVLIKRDGEHIDSLILNTGGILVAAIFLLPLSFLVEGVPHFIITKKLLLSVLYLGLFCSAAGFFIYFYLQQRVSVFKMSLSAYLTPLVAIFLGYVFFNEILSLKHYIGMLFIMLGIFISGSKHARKKSAGNL